MSPAELERFFDKVSPEPMSGCWFWAGACDTTGYGRVVARRRVRPAHRVLFEHIHGPVAQDLELDHLCRVRSCVNPAHLEPVTHVENMRRGARPHWRKTHCPAGHPYSGDNLIAKERITPRGSMSINRQCLTCSRVSWRDSKRRTAARRLESA